MTAWNRWLLPGYESTDSARRVAVSLHTKPVIVGARSEIQVEVGRELGGLPTARLVVRSWAPTEEWADDLARRTLTDLRDALTAELESLPSHESKETV